jgi:hypothetical protein
MPSSNILRTGGVRVEQFCIQREMKVTAQLSGAKLFSVEHALMRFCSCVLIAVST